MCCGQYYHLPTWNTQDGEGVAAAEEGGFDVKVELLIITIKSLRYRVWNGFAG